MTEDGSAGYDAEVRYTSDGAPHVRAGDWGGLGFGQGWAAARDQLPAIADQLLKVRSERARHLGAGPDGSHLASDLGYLALDVAGRAVAFRDAQPTDLRDLIAGYVAGYNRAVDEAHRDGTLPDWCADAEWVRPVTELEYYAHLVDVALMASGRNLVGLIGRAEAPGPDGPVPPAPLGALGGGDAASNGWAVGGDVTASGHGMVLANPHFPWHGEARFWECHLTIPGQLDAYGVSLLGTPGVQLGFNEGLAWTHTFSCGHRFTVYRLELSPDDPTRYRYGDDERAMTSRTHAVAVRGDDGGLVDVSRTLWATHHGPMLNLPLLGWGLETGFAYRDANLDNAQVIEQFARMNQATDLDGFRAVYADVQGIPWVNTLAADRSGRAWYIDASATPRLSAAAQQRFVTRLDEDLVAALLHQNRIALLDGSDPDDEWLDHPDARAPGLEPYSELPQVERRDVLVNANDSHWLTTPHERLAGHSPLHGLEDTARTLRTRQNLRLGQRLAVEGGVTVDDLITTLFTNESLSAELLVDAVVDRCRAAGTVVVEGHEADLGRVADVLERWDRRYDLTSRGAALWRELVGGFAPADRLKAGPLFAEPFDVADPVATPAGLASAAAGGDDPIVRAAGDAVRVLDAAGVALDAPLGEVQWVVRGDERVAVHGGGEAEGMMNVLGPWGALASLSLEPVPPKAAALPGRMLTGLAPGGYQCDYGVSFVMAVELTDDGPHAVGLLAYGQTGDVDRPEHRAGTDAYAVKQVRPLLFRDADIDAALASVVPLNAD
jgi:acyl-homoserine-lactone acylase